MPRTGRKAAGGVIYHVLNRGNGGLRLFRKPADYDAFVALLAQTRRAVPGVRLLAYCLMPNHWHLVLWPRRDDELSRFMLRLCTAHVRRHHAHLTHGRRKAAGPNARDKTSARGGATARRGTNVRGAASPPVRPVSGHLYQGRFKSFPVDDDQRYLLALLRYVESNPLRARPPLARSPRGWRWTSFAARGSAWAEEAGLLDEWPVGLLDEWPVDVPRHWESLLAEALPDEGPGGLAALRTAVARGRPFGREAWVRSAAERLGLEFTLHPRGRPPKPGTAPRGEGGTKGKRKRQGKGKDMSRANVEPTGRARAKGAASK